MEDNREKKDYKPQNIQKFYFNDEGQLVVESNKGVWVDGEPYVKMYGNFTCNAKTVGIIISQMKGVPVLTTELPMEKARKLGSTLNDGTLVISSMCIVNPTMEQTGLKEENRCLKERLTELDSTNSMMLEKIHDFNALPWYKRMFKKIEVK